MIGIATAKKRLSPDDSVTTGGYLKTHDRNSVQKYVTLYNSVHLQIMIFDQLQKETQPQFFNRIPTKHTGLAC